jgi:hypothetical protein
MMRVPAAVWNFHRNLRYHSFQDLKLALLLPKKLQLFHYMPRRRFGEMRYSSYSFSTSALDAGEWSASPFGRALSPGERTPGTFGQEARWAPAPVWTQRLQKKFFRLCRGSNLDRPAVQPVARYYSQWATRLTCYYLPLLYIHARNLWHCVK